MRIAGQVWRFTRTGLFAAGILCAFGLAACEKDTEQEVQEAVDAVGEEMEKHAEQADDMLRQAGEELGEGMEQMTDKMEEAGDRMKEEMEDNNP